MRQNYDTLISASKFLRDCSPAHCRFGLLGYVDLRSLFLSHDAFIHGLKLLDLRCLLVNCSTTVAIHLWDNTCSCILDFLLKRHYLLFLADKFVLLLTGELSKEFNLTGLGSDEVVHQVTHITAIRIVGFKHNRGSCCTAWRSWCHLIINHISDSNRLLLDDLTNIRGLLIRTIRLHHFCFCFLFR